jgi:hypothetical protein
VTERAPRDPFAEHERTAVPLDQSARHPFGHDQVGRAQPADGEQAAHQRVDAGVRRVRDDPEGVSRPPEGSEVDLEHRDRAPVEAGSERAGSRRVDFDGEDPTPEPGQRGGERAVPGAQVHDDVAASGG